MQQLLEKFNKQKGWFVIVQSLRLAAPIQVEDSFYTFNKQLSSYSLKVSAGDGRAKDT